MSKLFTNASNVALRAVLVVKRMWPNRILANSPVLLIALSVSLASVYSIYPNKVPATNSGDKSQQQITIKQTQPTSSAVEASETAPSAQADNTTVSDLDNTSESLTNEEISPSTISNPTHDLSEGQPYTVAEPPDGCSGNCDAVSSSTPSKYGCGGCLWGMPKTNSVHGCDITHCID